MTLYQTVIDDFNDNSFNTTLWWSENTTGITETSGTLHMHAVEEYADITSKLKYDITDGFLAMKLRTDTGSTTPATEFYFGVRFGFGDSADAIVIQSTPDNNWWQFISDGAITVSDSVGDGEGLGTDWNDGDWIGIGNLGVDNLIYLYYSSDGSTWTEIGHCTVSGTFNKTHGGLFTQCGVYEGTTTWTAVIDDASYFGNSPPSTDPIVKVRVGGAWVDSTPKVRVGGAWVIPDPKVRVGGAWVTPG